MKLFAGKKIIFTPHQNPNYLLQNSTANKADELIFVTNQPQDRIMIAQAIADMAKK